MFRHEFMTLISSTGLLTIKDLRPLAVEKGDDVISELKLAEHPTFDDVKFAQIMAKKYKLRFMDLSNARIPKETIESFKKTLIVRFRYIPIQKTPQAMIFAIYDPSVIEYMEDIKNITKTQVQVILTNLKSWKKIYDTVGESVDEILDQIIEVNADRPEEEEKSIKAEDIGEEIVRSVNKMLASAFIQKVSDIHVEPYEKRFRIRFRLDGSLREFDSPNMKMMLPIISRLKIMAKMDIAEKRKPQDGRIKLAIKGVPIDYRVSSLPTLFGEKVCLRLLDQSNLQLDMTKLGFEPKQLEVFKNGIHRPFGMCLVTGPTGSGKTTTLYSGLFELNKPDTNISTAEDPVEFNLEGINQVNVRKDIGLTFASALKAFLRQDPDVIMVGEIRDLETGEIAVEAALTGHMVLSTLHTNDAPATITRLLNMGIEPFLITGALNVVVAQRLCRRICASCKQEEKVSQEYLVACGYAKSTAEKLKIYKGVGCEACGGTGYKGRVAIYEVLHASASIKELILSNESAEAIKKQAIREGMKTLRMSALTKVAQGLTTLEEAIGNSSSDK